MKDFKRIVFILAMFLAAIVVACPSISMAGPLDVWHWRNPLPQGNDLNGVTFGNGTFVAVGNHGTILTSPDGINWIIRTSGTKNFLARVAFGNGIFVAVGSAGAILTSVDSVNWTTQVSGTAAWLKGVVFGAGLFVAVGDIGTILTSSDGIIWAPQTSGITGQLTGVALGNGIFVAGGLHDILTSIDGVNWVSVSGHLIGFNDIAFGNGIFVAVGGWDVFTESAIDFVRTSPDGLNWNTTKNTNCAAPLTGITFGNGVFVAVTQGWGQYGNICPSPETSDNILTSEDGANWTVAMQGLGLKLNGVGFGNSGFIAVGQMGKILSSSDGVDWTDRNSGPTASIFGITFANNLFVAVGDGGAILTSPDGGIWTPQTSGTANRLNGVAFGNEIFVAVGDLGTVLTSPDGANWTLQALGIAPLMNWDDVAFGNGVFVAIGRNGGNSIFTSSDGINWSLTPITPDTVAAGRSGVAFGNGTFVAVTGIGAISTSHDGINWTFQIDTPLALRGVAFGSGIFVVVGIGGSLTFDDVAFISPDGVTWTSKILMGGGRYMAFLNAQGVGFGNNFFIVLGRYILASPDAVNWTAIPAPVSLFLINDFVFGNNRFVAVGEHGTILQSDPIIFSDVSLGYWAEDYIYAIYNAGVTFGYGDGRYGPEDRVTRGQMAAFIVRAKEGDPTGACVTPPFPDVPVDYIFCKNIERLKGLGITMGFGDGTYRPEDFVTRQEMASFLVRAVDQADATTCLGTLFTDVPLGAPHCANIERLRELNVTLGCTTGMYCPSQNVLRDQMAAFLARAFLGMQ
jgi:hypothetical protein